MCLKNLSFYTKPNLHKQNSIQWSDTIQFIPPIHTGEIIKIIDINTIVVASHLPYESSPLYRFTVILQGIDCSNIHHDINSEKIEELENLLLNKTIIFKNIKNENYGRILADIYLDNLHVNQYIIDKKFAPPCITVKKSDEWFKLYIKNKVKKETDTDIYF